MSGLATLMRLIIIAVFTAIESASLIGWLFFVRDKPSLSVAVGIGLGILAVGLVIEHLLTDIAVNGLLLDFPFGAIILFSITETVLWGIWLEIVDVVGGLTGFFVALVVLAILLVPQHSIEDNVLQGRSLLANLLNSNTLVFSVIESVGATLWLIFVLRPEFVTETLQGIEVINDIVDTIGISISTNNIALIGVGILAISLFIEHIIAVSYSRRITT